MQILNDHVSTLEGSVTPNSDGAVPLLRRCDELMCHNMRMMESW